MSSGNSPEKNLQPLHCNDWKTKMFSISQEISQALLLTVSQRCIYMDYGWVFLECWRLRTSKLGLFFHCFPTYIVRETVKFQVLIHQEAKDHVHALWVWLHAMLIHNVLCRTSCSEFSRWQPRTWWGLPDQDSLSFFFMLLKKDESCAQSKACFSPLLLLTVKSLIYFRKYFLYQI